ncbi:LacI family DNA-binding transcriptional regulator [Lachnospiraceae bacterium LCP25S3_G4]
MNIKEIAKIAGVSPATISLVVNNKKGVSEKKRKEVKEILEKYNYKITRKSNIPMRNLLFLKYRTHGMIVEENAGFIQTIMDSIEAECRNTGYNLSIIVSVGDIKSTLSSINYENYHGIFVLGTELDKDSYPHLKEIPIPYIVIDNIMPHFDCNSIAIDNEDMVFKAIQHLNSLGYQDIGYFCSNLFVQNFDERSKGLEQAVSNLGITFKPEHKIAVTPTMMGAYNDMKSFLATHKPLPQCAFVDNDTIAIGIIKALKESGFLFPNDIAIIGFDDIHFAAVNSPSLSTVQVPRSTIGTMALRHLMDAIESPSSDYFKIRVGGKLIIRHSTYRSK